MASSYSDIEIASVLKAAVEQRFREDLKKKLMAEAEALVDEVCNDLTKNFSAIVNRHFHRFETEIVMRYVKEVAGTAEDPPT